MSHLTERFPDAISYGVTGGPGFGTDVVQVHSGYEIRNQRRSIELNSWDVAHAAREPEKWKPLARFFREAGGRANTFPFKDWSDYQVTIAQGIFTMLTATTFQMWKRYGTYDRKILLPISPATVTGTALVGTSVSYTTGIVTVTSGTPTAWSGEFDVPCRFDIDKMNGTILNRSGAGFIIGWESIPIVEVRVL